MRRAPCLITQLDRWPEWIRALYREGVLGCTHAVFRLVKGRLPARLMRADDTRQLGRGLIALDVDDVGVAEAEGEIVIQ